MAVSRGRTSKLLKKHSFSISLTLLRIIDKKCKAFYVNFYLERCDEKFSPRAMKNSFKLLVSTLFDIAAEGAT